MRSKYVGFDNLSIILYANPKFKKEAIIFTNIVYLNQNILKCYFSRNQ